MLYCISPVFLLSHVITTNVADMVRRYIGHPGVWWIRTHLRFSLVQNGF